MKSATRMFVAEPAATAVLAASTAAAAGPGNANVSVPGANVTAGPGYFNGCINGWCWNTGG